MRAMMVTRKSVGMLWLLVLMCLIQTDFTFAQSSCPNMDLALVIPTSSDSNRWSQMKTFVRSVLNGLDIGGSMATVRVSVVKYAGSSQVEFLFTRYQTKTDILAAIDNMQPLSGNGRNVADAEQQLRSVFATPRTGAQMMSVVFFDGPSDNKNNTLDQAQGLNNLGVYLLSVGLGGQVDMDELQRASTHTSDNAVNVYTVSSYDQLTTSVNGFNSFLCKTRKPICPKQADVVLILDQSTSIVAAQGGYSNWDLIKNFTISITSAFPIAIDLTRIGLIKFSTTSSIIFNLNTYTTTASLQAAVTRLTIDGGETNIYAALTDALSLLTDTSRGARVGVKKIAFLMTDGKANRDAEKTQSQANATRQAGVEIFCIGMTNQVDNNELSSIASDPDSTHYFFASNFASLGDVLVRILGETCLEIQTTTTTTTTTTTRSPSSTSSTPTTSTTPTTTTTTTTTPTTTSTTTTTTTTPTTTSTTTSTTTTPTTTSTTTSTTTTTPTTTTTTPTTTTTTPTTTKTTTTTTTMVPSTLASVLPTCNNSVDLIFMVDATANLDYRDFRSILEFIRDVCLELSIDSKLVQVGLMVYSDQPKGVFQLNTYHQTTDIRDAIANASYIGERSNVAGALEFLRTTMFTTANGDRPEAPNVGVLFITSRSNSPVMSRQQADLCRRAGITLLVVALGNWLDVDEINNIGSYPTNSTVLQTTVNTLPGIRQLLVNLICQNVNYCLMSNPCQNGGKCFNQIGSSQCICSPGYGGSACNQVCRNSVDVVFAIDSSGSIGLTNWRLVRSFLVMSAQMLDLDSAFNSSDVNAGSRVGLLTFSNKSNIIFNLNTFKDNKASLLQALNTPYEGGETNTAAAIRTVVDQMFTEANGDRPNATNYLVLMTDGLSDNTTATWAEAMRARDKGIIIIAVGVGSQYNYLELRSIASYPDTKNVLTTANFTTLTPLASTLGSLLCENVNECQTNPCLRGKCIDGSGSYQCTNCPANTTGSHCERNCTGFVDLVLIMDVSGSIEMERFPIVKEYIVKLLQDLNIESNATRIAAIYFSDNASVAFYLNSYTVKQDVMQAVRNIPFTAGKTNTASALRLLYSVMYDPKNGGRPSAKRLCVVFTDGAANIDAALTFKEAVKVHQIGVQVIVVAAGEPAFVDSDQVYAIASEPTDVNVIPISSYYSLPSALGPLLNATCNDVNECLSNPCQNGATCVDDCRRYFCICPTNYAGYNCERQCSERRDVVFVLDFSGSIEEIGYYRPMMKFLKDLITGMDIRSGSVRVGVVVYTGQVDDQILLKDYDRQPLALIDAISFSHDGGKTNTQGALTYVQNVQFTGANGDRPSVPNCVILMSDGYSDVTEGSGPGADAAARLKASGATIYTVGLGDSPNLSELSNIASGNMVDGNYLLPTWDPTDVSKTVNGLLNDLCDVTAK